MLNNISGGKTFGSKEKYYLSLGFFMFSGGLSGIFINILFFVTSNLESVIIYQIALQISQTIFFIISTYLMKVISARYLFISGNILRALTIALLFVIPYLSQNALFFGLLIGVSSGIFWSGNATFSLEISKGSNRMVFLSINSAISSVASLISPTLGGLLISYSNFHGLYRYSMDFALSSILLLLSSLTATFIKNNGEKGGSFSIKTTIIKEKNYSRYRAFFFFSSILGMAMSTLIPVYIYYLSGSYIVAGIYGSVTALGGFLSNIMAPMLSRKLGKKIVYVIPVMLISSILFTFHLSYSIILVFIASLIILLFLTPLSNMGMSDFMQYLDKFTRTRHFWINREYYLVSGRILSLISILAYSDLFSLYSSTILMPFFALSLLGFIPVFRMRSDI